MLPIFNITDEMTSPATSMDISESFRPEDLSKTDFFDFVSAPPEQEGNQATQNDSNINNNNNNDQPLQGFDQVSIFHACYLPSHCHHNYGEINFC
jgi:hypothetical protein